MGVHLKSHLAASNVVRDTESDTRSMRLGLNAWVGQILARYLSRKALRFMSMSYWLRVRLKR